MPWKAPPAPAAAQGSGGPFCCASGIWLAGFVKDSGRRGDGWAAAGRSGAGARTRCLQTGRMNQRNHVWLAPVVARCVDSQNLGRRVCWTAATKKKVSEDVNLCQESDACNNHGRSILDHPSTASSSLLIRSAESSCLARVNLARCKSSRKSIQASLCSWPQTTPLLAGCPGLGENSDWSFVPSASMANHPRGESARVAVRRRNVLPS